MNIEEMFGAIHKNVLDHLFKNTDNQKTFEPIITKVHNFVITDYVPGSIEHRDGIKDLLLHYRLRKRDSEFLLSYLKSSLKSIESTNPEYFKQYPAAKKFYFYMIHLIKLNMAHDIERKSIDE